MRRVALCVVAACGSRPAATAHPPRVTERPYLKLIEPDNEWTLPIKIASGHYDHGYQTDQHADGKVHCRIAKLERIGEASVARLACDKPYDDLSISGTWVAQPGGLYHPLGPITQPDDLATLVDDDLLITERPHERDHSHTTEVADRRVDASRYGDGWCVHDKTSALGLETNEFGDRRSFILCFDAAGIFAASEYDTVASDHTWRSAQIGVHPPADPEDPLAPIEVDY